MDQFTIEKPTAQPTVNPTVNPSNLLTASLTSLSVKPRSEPSQSRFNFIHPYCKWETTETKTSDDAKAKKTLGIKKAVGVGAVAIGGAIATSILLPPLALSVGGVGLLYASSTKVDDNTKQLRTKKAEKKQT